LQQAVGNVAAYCGTVPHPGAAVGITGTSSGHDPKRLRHPAGKGPQDSRHDRLTGHSGHDAGRPPGQGSQGQGSPGRGWPGPTAGRWPGSSAGVAPRPHARHARASTAAFSRTHAPSHREAACGSAPGTQRSSPSHPPNLSGQNGGC
jgi:hypothetical protein